MPKIQQKVFAGRDGVDIDWLGGINNAKLTSLTSAKWTTTQESYTVS